MAWPNEEIPDRDVLFMRVHRKHVVDGEIIPGAFRNRGAETTWHVNELGEVL